MDIDLAGRIENTKLPRSNGLYPLFEAISNSIHSIEEAKQVNGRIDIEILRDSSQLGLIDGEPLANQPIIGFSIKDNVSDLRTTTLSRFRLQTVPKKRSKGGKGVGRLLWLKAFEKAEIDSVFCKGDKRLHRKFEFTLSKNGIENPSLSDANGQDTATTIRLLRFKPEYRDYQQWPEVSIDPRTADCRALLGYVPARRVS